MNSIVKHGDGCKCVVEKRKRKYTMIKGDLGLQVKREPIHIWRGKSHKVPKRVRGDLIGFSNNSRSRLRVLLSTARWNGPECARFGITLTLPWAATPDEWRKVWHDWVVSLRKFPIGLIWRIELTTGKSKKSGGKRRCHVHAMVWVPVVSALIRNQSKLFESLNDKDLKAWLNLKAVCKSWVDVWLRSAPSLTENQINYATSMGERKGCGIVVKRLDDSSSGAIHYLCDHATKHKEEQLGWQGRQWGVVNRRNFSFVKDGLSLDGEQWAIVSRQLRRVALKKRKLGEYAAQPYGDNKCYFGKSEERLQCVLNAVSNGLIS